MAGDRGLAFVVVGLIGLSAFIVSNHGYIGPASGARSESLSSVSAHRAAGDAAAEETVSPAASGYIFQHGSVAAGPQGDVIGKYPELSAPAAENLPRIQQRFRLVEELPAQDDWAIAVQ